jgi:SAM-dependent methyltransferase
VSKKIADAVEMKRASGHAVQCNFGCGTRFHPDWINVDFLGDRQAVFAWNLRRGLPLADSSCDAVYSSHAIEHFDRDGARRFVKECLRVLKPGGIIRLVAPDLEGIARVYLSCLDAIRREEAGAAECYEWAVIELLDQLVRHQSGGEMLKYWSQPVVPAEDFVAERVGTEYWRAREIHKKKFRERSAPGAREIGHFRLGGEVHQWMYDRYALGKLLADCGFRDVHPCQAHESAIEGFVDFNLDTEPDGSIYKPDSFFVEAIAP